MWNTITRIEMGQLKIYEEEAEAPTVKWDWAAEVWHFCICSSLLTEPRELVLQNVASYNMLHLSNVQTELFSTIQVITLTVSSENHSRFSCMVLTHQAWDMASSPARNSPAAMETHCCQGHCCRMHNPEKEPDRPRRESPPLTPSWVVSDPVGSSAEPSGESLKLLSRWLCLTLLRIPIFWENSDYL